MRPLISKFLIASILFLFTGIVAFAQTDTDACEAFLARAFLALSNSCASNGEESACYGFGEVSSTFFEDVPQIPASELGLLQEPADTVPLLDLDTLRTLETIQGTLFNLSPNVAIPSVWGLANLNIPANLPEVLEGRGGVITVLGEAEIENGVRPEDAVILPEDGVEITLNNVTLYTAPPNLNFVIPSEEITTLTEETTLIADGLSLDAQWLRVFYLYEREFGSRATAWIPVSSLPDGVDVAGLPFMGPDLYTTFQNFYLRNSYVDPNCELVPPNGILVQGPSGIETDVVINDLPVRVITTSFLEVLPPGNRMRITTLDGFTILNPDTSGQVVIPAGFQEVVCLEGPLDLGINAESDDFTVSTPCADSGVRRADNDLLLSLSSLESIPSNVVASAVQIPIFICASGVGGVVCEIRNLNAQTLADLREGCSAGTIEESICDSLPPA